MSRSYYFNDDELMVLASLIGGTLVYGVKSKLFSSYRQSYHEQVKQIIERLQEKQMIRLDYDGKFHIQKEVYEMVEVMSHPEHLLFMQTTLFNGQKEVNYYYKKKQHIYWMKKGQHLHTIKKSLDVPKLLGDPLNINERLTTFDLQAVNEYLDWFDEDGALDYLAKHTHHPELVKQILDKSYDETCIEYYIWEDAKVIHQQKLTVGILNQQTFEWISSHDDILIQGGTRQFDKILQMMFRG